MIATETPRRSSSRRDTLHKVDGPRAIDRWISYFGEVSSSPPPLALRRLHRGIRVLTVVDGRGQDRDLDRRALGL